MSEFEPTIVYRCPGPHQRLGGTYDYRGADSQESFDSLISSSWHNSLTDAVASFDGVPIEIDETSAPTREELELMAKELDLDFDGRTSDKKLAERIDTALKVGE